MEMHPWYPNDYRSAMNNTLTKERIDSFLRKPGTSSRFVYGVLTIPTALKYHISMDQSVDISKNMTQATLFGYQLYTVTEGGVPVIAQSSNPQASVEGMLIFDLNEAQRNAVYEFEAGLMELVSVDVEICQRDSQNMRSLRKIDLVGTFVLQGGKKGYFPVEGTAWKIDTFLQSSFYKQIEQSQSANSLANSMANSMATSMTNASAESAMLGYDQRPQDSFHEERGV
jgi:hypothetical protein